MIATDKEKKTVNLGFIGVGWIGRNRMEAILHNTPAQAQAIAEPEERTAQEALKSAPGAALRAAPEAIYKDPELDGVVIATPSAMHAQQSIDALAAGKAVFCQKPLGRTAAEVKKVVDASKKANKLLAVDLSYRYTEAFKAAYEVIQKREIGETYAVDLIFHNAYGPDKEWFYDVKRSGGGCVMDLGIHLVDMAMWCLDFPRITEVRSNLFHKGRKIENCDKEIEDFASVVLDSEKDQVINLECSWHVSAGQDAVIEARFYGTKGGVAVKNINGSFYDFTTEKYCGTQKETLVEPPDNWGGRAGIVWVEQLFQQNSFHQKTADEFIKTAEIIDRIYGR